jgi:uncharacterized repeat protein (TIGR02543 family)
VETFPFKKVIIAFIAVMAIVAGVGLYLGSEKNDPTTTTPEASGTITLTMAVNGNGSTSPLVGTHIYAKGTVIPITAMPDSGWQFDGWIGDDVVNPNSAATAITMDTGKTVTANFNQISQIVEPEPVVEEPEPVAEEPEPVAEEPEPVVEKPEPVAEEPEPVAEEPEPVAEEPEPVVESEPAQYTLTIYVAGIGTVTGAGIYDEGTVVLIGAIPASGWEFVVWGGDIATIADTSSSNTTIVMDSNKTIVVIFSR